MSHYQSRGGRSESTQYRRTGRSGSSNQQRQFSGGAPINGSGGGGTSAPTNPPNRSGSFRKYNSNGPVGHPNARNLNVDSNNLPPAQAVENRVQPQQPTHRVSDAPVMITSSNVKPIDAPTQNITRAVPKAPSCDVPSAATPSNLSGVSSEPNAPRTPHKAPGEASKLFPLQFGSISPSVMNVQLPARTSSAPPNLDEQKKSQTRHESVRTAPPPDPIPSVPSQQLLKKDPTGIIEKSNAAVETQQASRSKRDDHVSAPAPLTQAQKPSLRPVIPVRPMQIPFHQSQGPVQFGGPNLPQIQSQPMSGMSLSMPMPMSLPPSVQHSMFLQPHHMQTQGLVHQGQSLNFSPQIGLHLPPQLGSMGMNMAQQFPQQPPAVQFVGSRKTVKITNPRTHEELRLGGSPNSRLHPNMQSQSQPSFAPNIPMNFYPSSFTQTSLIFPTTSSVPLSGTQVSPITHPPRLYSPVTVKPPVGPQLDREPLPPISSMSVGKEQSSKPSILQGVDLISHHKSTEKSSSLQQAKPGSGASSASTASASTSSSGYPRNVVVPDSIEDKRKKPVIKGLLDPVGSLPTSQSNLPSQLPEAEGFEAKESKALTVAASCESSNLTSECSTKENTGDTPKSLGTEGENSRHVKPETIRGNEQKESAFSEGSNPYDHSLETSVRLLSLESQKITGKIEEKSDSEVTSSASSILKHAQEEQQGHDVKVHVNLASPSETSASETRLSMKDDNFATSDVSLTVPHSAKTPEQKSASILISSLAEDALRSGSEDIDNSSGKVVSLSPSSPTDKVLPDVNVAKTAVPRGKKKKKDLFRKAEAAGQSSDLYMAYKGPEDNKGSATPAEVSENSSSSSEKQKYTDMPLENAMPSQLLAQTKAEPDDWEDAAEISSPGLETAKNVNQGDDGNGETTKKYSRDFLLKFLEQCLSLPDGFKIDHHIVDTLMVSGLNISHESHPSPVVPVRNTERPVGGSRLDRRDEDKWSKFPEPPMLGRGEMSMNFPYGQGVNYGVPRNPRAQTPVQFVGGVLPGQMMQSFGPQGGLQRNNSDSDRWQRGTGLYKGLMPSPHAPMHVMHKAEKKYELGRVTDEEQAKQRQLKGILNKLTPQNFEKLFEQVKEVNIDNVITLSGVISQIFDKALLEPTFCEMYANFCFHLAVELPDLSVDTEIITFKRLLLNKCQEEFERGEREEQEANKAEEECEIKQTAEEREEKRLQVRRRMLGNIRLIGELYKKRMLTERIMHECINKLLGQYQNPDEENIEALCKLMSTIGEMIDHPKAKEFMDAYFDIMSQLSNNMKLSSRVRFMLKDAIDLRKNKWQQRRKVDGPKKIEEVHRDVAQERQAQTSRLSRIPSMGNSVRRGPPMEFAPRSFSMSPSPGSQVGGFRGIPPQLRGYGSQEARVDERHSSDNRVMPVRMPQRPLGDDSVTLGPQGGLARGMAFRGQPLSGQNGFGSVTQRSGYMPESFVAPIYEQSHPQERDITYGNREARNKVSNVDKSQPSSPRAQGGQSVSFQNVSSSPDEELIAKSLTTIKEFYSARDENEVAMCIKDLNSPSFYPSMISTWITDSFERKDIERDLLTKLLINLTRPQDSMISKDQLIEGFGFVLDVLEDSISDAPKAAEFLGRIFAKVILENIISLSTIEQLIYEGGEKQEPLVEPRRAAVILGSIFDFIKSEKGDSVLNEICSSSKKCLK